ncbi:hypothetical protein J7F01_13075 [Streptomyces sp. ISL-22]|uniref:hypothetical protein n=1 Tax=unclassified Streptomyces TaxID=2593676 RepID=UPI001BE9D142|nr:MULTISPECIES: hypothetical protein [unclassified Streptomyces]MBT2420281.1 hypothetical protein [Streptomyces sp. ISL-24]MBT2433105.1 hypothetical protein [Streptomyces sp. ISL-22]
MSNRPGSETRHPGQSRGDGSAFLGIYLNDHLAGATAGTDRARHLVRSCEGSPLAATLGPIAAEIAEDRASLIRIMRRLGIPVRHYKVYAGRAAERVGRLKSNGRLVRRSPLSTLWELEALRLGVEGKAAGWESLRLVADTDERLDPRLLDELLERARRQQSTLERLRREQAGAVFQGA